MMLAVDINNNNRAQTATPEFIHDLFKKIEKVSDEKQWIWGENFHFDALIRLVLLDAAKVTAIGPQEDVNQSVACSGDDGSVVTSRESLSSSGSGSPTQTPPYSIEANIALAYLSISIYLSSENQALSLPKLVMPPELSPLIEACHPYIDEKSLQLYGAIDSPGLLLAILMHKDRSTSSSTVFDAENIREHLMAMPMKLIFPHAFNHDYFIEGRTSVDKSVKASLIDLILKLSTYYLTLRSAQKSLEDIKSEIVSTTGKWISVLQNGALFRPTKKGDDVLMKDQLVKLLKIKRSLIDIMQSKTVSHPLVLSFRRVDVKREAEACITQIDSVYQSNFAKLPKAVQDELNDTELTYAASYSGPRI
jgi:hypothetical protein